MNATVEPDENHADPSKPREPTSGPERPNLPSHDPLKPLAARLGGKAANTELPRGLRTRTDVADAVRQALDAPADLALLEHAIRGTVLAVRSIDPMFRGCDLLACCIEDVELGLMCSVSAGATKLALKGRQERHLMYYAATRIGALAAPPQLVLQWFGCQVVLRLFNAAEPSPTAIAAAMAELSAERSEDGRPDSWLRRVSTAERKLEQVIDRQPRTAEALGLRPPKRVESQLLDPVAVFNDVFKRRQNDLKTYATKRARSGGGGYGTFCSQALTRHGGEVMDGIRAGCTSSMTAALEIVTTLPSESLLKLPVQCGIAPPESALAWLDLQHGRFCHVLHQVTERGLRPPPGTEHLYEQTIQITSVYLSPPLVEQLRALATKCASPPNILNDILGDATHSPRSAVVQGGSYAITVRRMQESVPPLLLDRGLHRWPISLVTSSRALVSVGRPFYGACRTLDVNRANEAQHIVLDWPVPSMPDDGSLIGAFTVPTVSAVSGALNFLVDRADRNPDAGTLPSIVKQVNAAGDWLGMLWALAFALRRWIGYSIARAGIVAGAALVDDKDAHVFKGVALPVLPIIKDMLQAWEALILDAIGRLHQIGSDEACRLADKLGLALKTGIDGCPIFQIRGDLELAAVGYLCWHEALPLHLRLVPNFARQFWSFHLLLQDVPQLVADVLMRHQVADLHPGSTAHCMCIREIHAELLGAMQPVMERLGLRIPAALCRGEI